MTTENITNGTIEDDEAIVFKERKCWLFLGLPFTFTKYTITPSLVTVDQGLLNTVEDDCYMYKIMDVKLNTSIFERIVGLKTVVCYTGDVTHPEIHLSHIRHAREIKDYILRQSEVARVKRRTLNTVDIGLHGADLDGDGTIDTYEQ